MKMNIKKIGILALLAVLVIGIIIMVVMLITGRVAEKVVTPEGVILPEEEIISEELFTPEDFGFPALDVIGSDIVEVPRYPGSVRKSWSKIYNSKPTDYAQVSYYVRATPSEISDYYANLLAGKGWTMASVETIMGHTTLNFNKKPAACTIQISDMGGFSIYEIKYWPKWYSE